MSATSPAARDGIAITAKNLFKTYERGRHAVRALDGVDLEVPEGQFIAIMGTSGSGKSTLMNIIGGLDKPTSGEVEVAGVSLTALDKKGLARFRNKTIGFVFQQFNLLPRTTALRQVMLPLAYGNTPASAARELALRQLERVGLGERLDHEPSELSGGQQQRVAIARALVNDPSIILADEPTGALDSVTAAEIMTLLITLNKSGITIVLVTHDEAVARCANRIVRFKDGRIVSDDAVPVRTGMRLVS